jgi:hypothetical protein
LAALKRRHMGCEAVTVVPRVGVAAALYAPGVARQAGQMGYPCQKG